MLFVERYKIFRIFAANKQTKRMLYSTYSEWERIRRIVEYNYKDEKKHYAEWVSDQNDQPEADKVLDGGAPARKYKGHIFYDLFYLNRAIERILGEGAMPRLIKPHKERGNGYA